MRLIRATFIALLIINIYRCYKYLIERSCECVYWYSCVTCVYTVTVYYGKLYKQTVQAMSFISLFHNIYNDFYRIKKFSLDCWSLSISLSYYLFSITFISISRNNTFSQFNSFIEIAGTNIHVLRLTTS